jgi:hypothetical protein
MVKASDSQGTPVVVKVDRLDSNHTKVSVRSGVVGYWDKETSSKIQESIEKELRIRASGATAPKQESERSDQAAVSRITAVGIGPKDFIASNDPSEGRALNRRVEVKYRERPAE